METYIALLRGINVGGHRKIKMDDLRKMFAGLKCENVKTYIQSGNVVFDAADKKEDLAELIKQQIAETFGHDVPVIICTPEKTAIAFHNFPFTEEGGWKGYISFLPKTPAGPLQKALEQKSSNIEKFKVSGRVLYALVDKETNQKPRFSNGFVEKELGMFATTRNLRTVHKILQLTKKE